MTPVNASLVLPFSSMPVFAGADEAATPTVSNDADDPMGFLSLLMAHFPMVGSEPTNSPLREEMADIRALPGDSPSSTLIAGMQPAEESVPTGADATIARFVEEPGASLATPVSRSEVGFPQPAPGSQPPLDEQPKPGSVASELSRAIDVPPPVEHAVQAADGTDEAAEADDAVERSADIDVNAGSISRSQNPGDAQGMDANLVGKWTPEPVHTNAPPNEVGETDADGRMNGIALAESKRLANEPAKTAIPRQDEVRPAPLADRIHDTFRNHLDHLRQQGRVEVQMNLHPPELGRMQLHLTMEDNTLNVRMVVQNDAAKHVLDQQLEPLRIRFSDMGVNLGQLDVRSDGNAPNHQPTSDPERSSTSLQAGRNRANHLRSSYARATTARGLVDVIT